jgi:hypothetical protein
MASNDPAREFKKKKGERLLLHRCQIDGPHKEGEKPKKFPANFAIDLSFDTL